MLQVKDTSRIFDDIIKCQAMNVYSVTLSGPAPWGFRLQGGKDFSMPLTVSRLTPGGKAAQAGVGVGDSVVSIEDSNAEEMTHVEAQNKIRAAVDSLTLTLNRTYLSSGEQKQMEVLDKGEGFFEDLYHDTNHGVTPCPNKPVAKPEGARAQAPKSSTVSGGSSRPPWVTDPNFAERYRPDKTSTVVTQHTQPAQPTPEQNRSSILQAAQQNPEHESGRTPLCAACNKIIRGRYVVALGRSWHPEEFTCCQCRDVLDEGGFFEEKGSVYCTKCYDNRYAPNCAKCKKKIAGEIMHALKMTYHVQCFVCAACKRPIRNQAFYMEDGEPYCEIDYEKMFGTKCHGCDFKIDAGDRFLEALGYSWHDTCFVCALCHVNLEGKTFYSKKDKPLCKGHAFSPL
ncbi:PDZ and LIM domain protein 7 isoform X5 [Tachysurus fulvidraco]|uniref:PDZ and LIM domain protein 7 isoform X5 n=1 Tax=Tachysurus fulvidraco TaxID=1234273 RepID=UPI001FED2E5D|nr:PDZ and LIM domain protein 7 isoform X5 [Tachysurus fulvidraco]